jgi:hypothetical protein
VRGKASDIRQFEQNATAAFRFLETEFGFQRGETRPLPGGVVIAYNSEKVFVRVCYGPPEWDTQISFGRRGVDEPPSGSSFSIGHLKAPATAMPESLGSIEWQARILRVSGAALLSGNDADYERLVKARKAEIVVWVEKERLQDAVSAAERAWRDKDYRLVMETLEPFRGKLSALDARRLEYARRQVESA